MIHASSCVLPPWLPVMSYEKCIVYCTAQGYRFDQLKHSLENKYKSALYRDVLHIRQEDGEAFIFPFGVAVLWGLGYDNTMHLLGQLRAFEDTPHPAALTDEFTFAQPQKSKLTISHDHIELTGDPDPILEKIAISHGLAQSAKLEELEQTAQKCIEHTRNIPENIARSGHTRLSRREIARMRGRLYLVQSSIHLRFDLLDTPDFFWEYPELGSRYEMAANYLEVSKRIHILNSKLQVIHELFTMLADEQNHNHSSFLELIIIWLIVLEIFMFFAHDIFNLI